MPSLEDIARDVRSGTVRAEARAAAALEAIAAYDVVQPQTWISRRAADDLLAAARALDARSAAGAELPLAGALFAVKDNIDASGLPTTAACPSFAYQPAASATVVARLEAAGALVVGKTNLDQFATGLVGTRSPYGAPGCVFNRDYISGGSSSGSAVAVAAGLVDFALGTDTAGSGRVPAAFNGLVGLKPTRGRWSTTGLVPACRSLDCITVFAKTAADAAAVDALAAGFDQGDPYSRPDRVASPWPTAFRFGAPSAAQLDLAGDAGGFYAEAAARLEAVGGRRVEVDISPLLEAAGLLYAGPWVAERAAALEVFIREHPQAVHPVVGAIVRAGLGVSGIDAFRGQYELQRLAREAAPIWDAVDTLLLPTAPTIFRIDEVLAEPFALNSALGRFTNFANLLDLSAIAVPAGFRANGTGFGVTLIARAFQDAALLDLASRLGPTAPPPPVLDVGRRAEGVQLAVVGAHLAGMPLNWQLTSRGARLVETTRTAPLYRLYEIASSAPPKPALVHAGSTGAPIEVEVYELDTEAFGSFVAEVPPPLAIGSVELATGRIVKGFVAEPRALEGAREITSFGGWRGFMGAKAAS